MGDPSLQGRKSHAYLLYLGRGGSLWFSWLTALILPFSSGRGKSLAWSCRAPGPCSAQLACHGSESRAAMLLCTHRPRARTSRPSVAQKAGEQWKEDQKRATTPGKKQHVWYSLKDKRFFEWWERGEGSLGFVTTPLTSSGHCTGDTSLAFFCKTEYFSLEQTVESWRGFLVFPSYPGRLVQVTC